MKQARKIGMSTPVNASEVAAYLGRSRMTMTASKAAGYVFQYGRLTTVRHYLKWLAANPDFTTTAYQIAHSRSVRERMAAVQSRKNGPGRGRPRKMETGEVDVAM